MALYPSATSRSLLTVCFDGVGVIQALDDVTTPCEPTRLNLMCPTIVDASSSAPYLVVGTKDGSLSIFQFEPADEIHSGQGDKKVSIRPIRTITTGLASIYRIIVTKRGVIVGGFSKNIEFSFLFYDFGLDGSQKSNSHRSPSYPEGLRGFRTETAFPKPVMSP